MYRHVKSWESSEAYRVQRAAKGQTMGTMRQSLEPYKLEDPSDWVEPPPSTPPFFEADCLKLLAGFIIRSMTKDLKAPEDDPETMVYNQRQATINVLMLSEVSAARLIEIESERGEWKEKVKTEIVDNLPLTKRSLLEEKNSKGEPMVDLDDVIDAINNVVGILAVLGIEEIKEA